MIHPEKSTKREYHSFSFSRSAREKTRLYRLSSKIKRPRPRNDDERRKKIRRRRRRRTLRVLVLPWRLPTRASRPPPPPRRYSPRSSVNETRQTEREREREMRTLQETETEREREKRRDKRRRRRRRRIKIETRVCIFCPRCETTRESLTKTHTKHK